MVTLKNVNKCYPHHRNQSVDALRDINLTVAAGEIFGIIGRSGAGKSTLIRTINLLERPDQGDVLVDGQNLTQLSFPKLREMRRQIGMIFQHFNLLNHRTVYQNIALPLKLIGMDRKQIEQTVMPLLELTGLQSKQQNYPAQLSGGQKQRVAIARALVTQPKVLLCDEATSALDPETTLSILALLREVNRQYGLTIILITHEMAVIKTIAERVAVLDCGRIIECDSVVKIFTQPQTPITKTFVNTTLSKELPIELAKRVVATPLSINDPILVRLTYHRNASDQSTMTELVRQFQLSVSIIQGNIEGIGQETIGLLVLELAGEHAAIASAEDYLRSKDIDVEVLGYVHRPA